MPQVRCALCLDWADHFFLTLNNSLWAVCPLHTAPFKPVTVELDPEMYDLEGYFNGLDDDL